MDDINFVTDLKLYIVNNELGASLEGGKRWIAVTQEIQHIIETKTLNFRRNLFFHQ